MSAIPFHIVTMDFILALPWDSQDFDVLTTISDKFTKAIYLIPGKNT